MSGAKGWGLRKRARRVRRSWEALRGRRRADMLLARGEGVGHAAPGLFPAMLRRLSSDCNSVLDVGTGLMDSLTHVSCRVKIGMDVHRPYLEHRRVENAVPINAGAQDLSRLFVQGAVDLITVIDVIEHLEPGEARKLLVDAEAVAAKCVVIFTPRGEFPQSGHDAFHLGGEAVQTHRSAWDVGDFTDLGYRVIVLDGFHDRRNESFVRAFGRDAPPVDALLAWKHIPRVESPTTDL